MSKIGTLHDAQLGGKSVAELLLFVLSHVAPKAFVSKV
jgi:hypothetical protein